jgi:hypothetical protein
MAGILALPTTATTPDRWKRAGGSAGPPPSGRPTNQDSTAARTTGTGPATAATVSYRCYSTVQLAPWRIAVVCWIGWYEERAMGQRKGGWVQGQVGEEVLMEVVEGF